MPVGAGAYRAPVRVQESANNRKAFVLRLIDAQQTQFPALFNGSICKAGFVCPNASAFHALATANQSRFLASAMVTAGDEQGDLAVVRAAATGGSGSGSGSDSARGMSTTTITALQPTFYTVCPPGHYCKAGSPQPEACPAGTANPNPQQADNTACTSCGAGKYSDKPGSMNCKTCGSYTFTDGEGSLTCKCMYRHREYQPSDSTCVCALGYSADSVDEDCLLNTYEQCNDASRLSNGRCADGGAGESTASRRRRSSSGSSNTGASCDVQCGGPAEGLNRFGECECSSYSTYSDICDAMCHYLKPTLACGDSPNSFRMTDASGASTTFVASAANASGTCSPGTIALPVAFEEGVSVVHGIVADEAYFAGLFGGPLPDSTPRAPARTRASNSTHITSGGTPYLPNPIMCLGRGTAIIFKCSQASFPQYASDNLLNSNAGFDYGAFRELKQRMGKTNLPVSLFVHQFEETGLYVFADNTDTNKRLFVNVIGEGQVCPGANYDVMSSNSEAALLAAGATSSEINLEPDWDMLMLCILVVFGVSMIAIIVVKLTHAQTAHSYRPLSSAIQPNLPPVAQFVPGEPFPNGGFGEAGGAKSTYHDATVLDGFGVKCFLGLLDSQSEEVTMQLDTYAEELRSFYSSIRQQSESMKETIRDKDTTMIQAAAQAQCTQNAMEHDKHAKEFDLIATVEGMLDQEWRRQEEEELARRYKLRTGEKFQVDHFPAPQTLPQGWSVESIGSSLDSDDDTATMSQFPDGEDPLGVFGDAETMSAMLAAQTSKRVAALQQKIRERAKAQATLTKLFGGDVEFGLADQLSKRQAATQQAHAEVLDQEEAFGRVVDAFTQEMDGVNLRITRARDVRAKALQDRLMALKALQGAGNVPGNAHAKPGADFSSQVAMVNMLQQQLAEARDKNKNEPVEYGKSILAPLEKDLAEAQAALSLAAAVDGNANDAADNNGNVNGADGVLKGLGAEGARANLSLDRAKRQQELTLQLKLLERLEKRQRAGEQLTAEETKELAVLQENDAASDARNAAAIMELVAEELNYGQLVQVELDEAVAYQEEANAEKTAQAQDSAEQLDACADAFDSVVRQLVAEGAVDAKGAQEIQAKGMGMLQLKTQSCMKLHKKKMALLQTKMNERKQKMNDDLREQQDAELLAVTETAEGVVQGNDSSKALRIQALQEAIKARHSKQRAAMEGSHQAQQAQFEDQLGRLRDAALLSSLIKDQEELVASFKTASSKLSEDRNARLLRLRAEAAKRVAFRHKTSAESLSKLTAAAPGIGEASDGIDRQANLAAGASLHRSAAYDGESEVDMAARHARELAELEHRLQKEAAGREETLLADLNRRKAELQEQKEKQKEELLRQSKDISAKDAQQLVENFDQEYSRMEKQLDMQKSNNSGALQQKLAARRAARQLKMRFAQQNEQLENELGRRQKEADVETEQLRAVEVSTITTSLAEAHDQPQAARTELVIASVLDARHKKEVSDLEQRKEVLCQLAVTRAELAINDLHDQAVQEALQRQEQEMADLLAQTEGMSDVDVTSVHAKLQQTHQHELAKINAKHDVDREQVCSCAALVAKPVKMYGVYAHV